jgi:hypothetical protein
MCGGTVLAGRMLLASQNEGVEGFIVRFVLYNTLFSPIRYGGTVLAGRMLLASRWLARMRAWRASLYALYSIIPSFPQ